MKGPTLYLLFAFTLFGILRGSTQSIGTFQHKSETKNISGNSTFISNPAIDGRPDAIVTFTYSGANAQANLPAMGVWYNGRQWGIFNQDRSPMPADLQFTIQWQYPAANAFYRKADNSNVVNGKLVLDHPDLNQKPQASFYISQAWNPGGTGGIYNNAAIVTTYDARLQKWVVFNAQGNPLPAGSGFHIIISNASQEIQNGATTIQSTVSTPAQQPSTPLLVDASALMQYAKEANLDFENPFFQWQPTGNAFGNKPVSGNAVVTDKVLTHMQYNAGGIGGDYWKGLSYYIGIRGNNWVSSLYGNTIGGSATGTLTSTPLKVAGRYLTFLLSGGADISKLYVELQVRKADWEAAWGSPKRTLFGETADGFVRVNRISPAINGDDMFRYYFDLDAELNRNAGNKTIRIVLVDEKTNGTWAHLNADDFSFSNDVSQFITVKRNGQVLLADADKPVWGFADTHAHPTHQVGLGGQLIAGDTDGELADALSNATCDNTHKGRALSSISAIAGNRNPGLKDFFAQADWHMTDGFPDFAGFPKFNVKTHQQQHISWIKRAWEGGLRLLCALGVNNQFLATRGMGPGNNGQPLDDESVVLRELDLFKRIVAQNPEWMEIAYTPQDARRIILNGKLAVVLGVEMDNFGNFKDESYVWQEAANRDKPLVALTASNASGLIERKLNDYYNYGIRQVTPLHYVNGVFGGTAVFRGEPQMAGWAYKNRTNVAPGMNDGVGFNLYEDFNDMAVFLGAGLSYAGYCGHIHQQPAGSGEVSQVNADGLTQFGRELMAGFMKKGMLIDMDHMSYRSADYLTQLARQHQYPLFSSHTDPQGNSFISTPIERFAGTNADKFRKFGTTTIRYVRHEAQLRDVSMQQIRESGGVVAPILLPFRKMTYQGTWGAVANDCDGSSKTWAQMYLYALDKMNGKGVALSTDRGMVDFIGPRFGVNGAYALQEEKEDFLRIERRNMQRWMQKNGVRYDRPFSSYKPLLFEHAGVELWEEDVWKALAAWSAGINGWTQEDMISLSSEPGHQGRIKNFVKGLTATGKQQLLRPNWGGIGTGDGPWEQAAMFMLVHNLSPADMTDVYSVDDIKAYLTPMYSRIRPVFLSWKNMTGNNEPLRRLRNGNRDWDVNLDGLAHYGLLPDFIQDLKNIGFGKKQLEPLFASAEDYIQMWERAEAAKQKINK